MDASEAAGGLDPAVATALEPADAAVLELFEPRLRDWWLERFGSLDGPLFTPPQREAIPKIHAGRNTLICSPTGSGKTQSAFAAILNDLYRRERDEGLDNTVYCLYVSPLRSLANDIHRNLERPLAALTAEGDVDIRHAIRHGDTNAYQRGKMLEETPHVLNTTPETLAILLCAPKFREKLATVEYVVVDEIHSLAGDKRGTHLAVSLERLENLVETSPTRIGCSATIEPLDAMADFLVGRERAGGPARPCDVVDTRFVREYDLELVCPTADLVGTPAHELTDRFYERLHGWIADHDTTLVFTNTRSGAERVLFNLRERYPDAYDASNSGCHHGSLAAGVRQDVEARLKTGEVDVVTTSTSLELGIDMPTLDLVVQVGSPKSVASLLQRVGRAGHAPGDTVTGRVVALDRDELVECAVMVRKATDGFVDRVFVPSRCQDVAAQHVYGMAITSIEREADVLATLRRAAPYWDYTDDDWEQLMRYLTADYPGLEARNVYAKVWRDANDEPGGEHHYAEHDPGTRLVGRRGRLARVIYMQNVGTIPDSFDCSVLTRAGREWVGSLDEAYLDTLEPGDVLLLGGGRYEYRYRRGSNVYVDPTDRRPTVPSWFSERLPLSPDLGRAVLDFQGELLELFEAGGAPAVREWLRTFPIDEPAVYALTELFDAQVRYAGPESVATPGRLVVERELDRERYKRRYYVHSNYGRRFNDGLSRVVAHQCAERTDANVGVAVADNGFVLSMPLNRKVDPAAVIRELTPDGIRAALRASLADTDLLQRYFRINATRSLMILKQYKGREKSAAKQQVTSEMLLGFAGALDEFAVLEETYRELLEDKLDVAGLEAVLGAIQAGDLEVVSLDVPSPSPRAFGLATLSTSDVVLAEDESAALQRFHERVVRAIEGDGSEEPGRSVAAGGGE